MRGYVELAVVDQSGVTACRSQLSSALERRSWRDMVYFSIRDDEWPAVCERNLARLARHRRS